MNDRKQNRNRIFFKRSKNCYPDILPAKQITDFTSLFTRKGKVNTPGQRIAAFPDKSSQEKKMTYRLRNLAP